MTKKKNIKPLNPYSRLKKDMREWAGKMVYPKRRQAARVILCDEPEAWMLALYERACSARQLGYDMIIKVDDPDLFATRRIVEFSFVEKRPERIPFELIS